MRKSLFLYLFLFAALLLVFQYVNEKKIYESQERDIKKLKSNMDRISDSLAILGDAYGDAVYFGLKNNENAYSYFDKFGVEVEGLEQKIQDAVISKNTTHGNELVPYKNTTGVYKVNKVKVLNHKWAIADFTDGARWGEILLRYDIDKEGEITFETLQSLIYPKGY